jgi:poly(3-hydroxybutyrate) depolymerase
MALGEWLVALGLWSAPPPALPPLKVDAGRVAVVGLSSGAYMAQQLHFAHADQLIGAGLIAGGPYHCARGDLDTALKTCMAPDADNGPVLSELAAIASERMQSGALAPRRALEGDRVYVFHGQQDTTVLPTLGRAAAELYARLGVTVDLKIDFDRPVPHTMPTADAGSCASEAPYVSGCGLDLAGEVLKHLYALPAEAAPGAGDGALQAFDQRPFNVAEAAGIADTGYVYVPKACAAGGCGLLVALHGCRQAAEQVNLAFAQGAGFNRWADAARVVVLYPQTEASYLPLNPRGCWDWWGYSGADYDTRSGGQIRFLAELIRRAGQ